MPTVPFWIEDKDDSFHFPPVELALTDPNGLLAVGGNLHPQRLITAYKQGIFPWYNDNQPILWWSPDPRAVLFPAELNVSRSLRKTIRQRRYEISLDRCFVRVIESCAGPRRTTSETWISNEIKQAYQTLHEMGIAHSIEAWYQDELVGGLYGIALGGCFFGESMFSHQRDASKVAFVYLVRQLERWGYSLIDCQISSTHLSSLGARDIPRQEFMATLEEGLARQGTPAPWQFDDGFDPLQGLAEGLAEPETDEGRSHG